MTENTLSFSPFDWCPLSEILREASKTIFLSRVPGPPLDFIVSYLRWHRVGYRVLENDISMEQGTEVC